MNLLYLHIPYPRTTKLFTKSETTYAIILMNILELLHIFYSQILGFNVTCSDILGIQIFSQQVIVVTGDLLRQLVCLSAYLLKIEEWRRRGTRDPVPFCFNEMFTEDSPHWTLTSLQMFWCIKMATSIWSFINHPFFLFLFLGHSGCKVFNKM